ncbi:MAG: GTP cyclohydrolase I FolE, partial [Calditrichaeota bacterium]
RDLSFYSLCEHHLLPFFGTVDLLYVPRNGQVAGFSSLAKVVETLARRPQIQERLTQQIAQAIYQALAPEGVLVQVQAQHLCLSMRGERKHGARVATRTVLGQLEERHLQLLAHAGRSR